MAGGTCTISYDGNTIDLGTVTSFGRSYSKSVAVTPLVSLPMEQAFPLESASQLTVNISFSRVGDNTSWYDSLTQAMNRWQCRTDGFTLRYTPDSDNPFIPPTEVSGYIKSLSRTYSSDANQLVTGTMEFHVGTMYCSSTTRPYGTGGRAQSEFAIFIYDRDGMPQCILGGDDDQGVNCVDSYTLCGGLEEPFEYISINIPKKKLARQAPSLVEDGGIVAGKTRLSLYAVGTCEMTVTKCRLSNNTYRITAYSNAEKLRGYTLKLTSNYTPMYWIRYILTSGQYGVSYVEGDTLKVSCDNDVTESIRFTQGTSAWYALQVCAMLLGARVFFAEGNAYVVDYRRADGGGVVSDVGTIDLYGDDEYSTMAAGSVSLGDEGSDTIVNSQTIRYASTDSEGNSTYEEVTCTDDASIAVFDERSGGTIALAELFSVAAPVTDTGDGEEGDGGEEGEGGEGEGEEVPDEGAGTINLAQIWGDNYVSYRSEPQQSISFTLKEMTMYNGVPYWRPYYSPCSRADRIEDSVDEVTITNNSVVDSSRSPVRQRLTLSSFERTYPEGKTTYTWGVMQNIDLSTSTSKIVGTIDNS